MKYLYLFGVLALATGCNQLKLFSPTASSPENNASVENAEQASADVSNLAASGDPTQRCYAELTCSGDLNLQSQKPKLADLGIHYFFKINRAQPFPGLSQIQSQYPDRFQSFEKSCNTSRYSKMKLPASKGNPQVPEWGEDSRVIVGGIRMSCVSGRCSKAGEGCESNQDCCPSGNRFFQTYCDQNSRSCRSNDLSSQTTEKQNQPLPY